MTPDLLRAATGCSSADAVLYAPHYDEGCQHYAINTPERLSCFLAQVAHESGSLRYVREIASGRAYEGRRDLGNDQPGDGERYRGRGHIQCTGRGNYRRMTKWLAWAGCPDFEDFPEALEEPRWAVLSATAYWGENNLNHLADNGEMVAIGRAINRGDRHSSLPANGEADRMARWGVAKAAFAAEPTASIPPAAPTPTPAPTPAPVAAPAPGLTWPFNKPAQEKTVALPIIAALAGAVIDMFSNKMQKEIGRHTDPAAAEQITKTIVDAAKASTGIQEPTAALAEVVAKGPENPVLVQQVEAYTAESLEKMAPMLERMVKWEKEAAERDAAEREAASARNLREVTAGGFDMTKHLVLDSLFGVNVLIIIVAAVAVVQAIKSGKVDTEIWAAFTGLIGWRTAKAGTLYDYRFGGTTRTTASQIVADEITRKQVTK